MKIQESGIIWSQEEETFEKRLHLSGSFLNMHNYDKKRKVLKKAKIH